VTSLRKGDRVVVTGRPRMRSWEDSDGEKRQTLEVVADTVAASFRYATAELTRNERRDGNYEANQRQEAPREAPARPQPKGSPPRNDINYDEEPF
jgi:single-strand DNA-binding protein